MAADKTGQESDSLIVADGNGNGNGNGFGSMDTAVQSSDINQKYEKVLSQELPYGPIDSGMEAAHQKIADHFLAPDRRINDSDKVNIFGAKVNYGKVKVAGNALALIPYMITAFNDADKVLQKIIEFLFAAGVANYQMADVALDNLFRSLLLPAPEALQEYVQPRLSKRRAAAASISAITAVCIGMSGL